MDMQCLLTFRNKHCHIWTCAKNSFSWYTCTSFLCLLSRSSAWGWNTEWFSDMSKRIPCCESGWKLDAFHWMTFLAMFVTFAASLPMGYRRLYTKKPSTYFCMQRMADFSFKLFLYDPLRILEYSALKSFPWCSIHVLFIWILL